MTIDAAFAEALAQTDAYYDALEGWSYSNEQVDRWLQRWFAPRAALRPGMRVIDLCCGDGVWSRGLLRLEPALRITGFDISEAAVQWAQRRCAEMPGCDAIFCVHDAEQPLPIDDASINLIFARGLFLYNQASMMSPAVRGLLVQWHRKLAQDGFFFASYGSKPEHLGTYTSAGQTVLPMNHAARRSDALDFAGGKFNHTIASFTAPFEAEREIELVQYEFRRGRHTLVSRRRTA